MALQYISHNSGKHTAVIIPITEWNEITAKHKDLRKLMEDDKNAVKRKPSDFIGCISKETSEKMLSDIEKNRSEWNRDFN